MKRKSYVQAYPMAAGAVSRTMVLYFGISLVIHFMFIGSVVFWPASGPKPRFSPGSIRVNLVSLSGPPSTAPATAAVSKAPAKPVAVTQKEVKTAPIEEVVIIPPPKTLPEIKRPQKTVSLAPKPKKKPKRSLKKRTQNRQNMIDHALSKVKKKVEKTETDSVSQALNRLKKKVEQTESSRAQAGSTGLTAAGAQGGGATGSGGRRRLELIDLYKIEIAFQIERNWAFSQQVAGESRALQVSLVFKVMPDGEIADIRFTEHSGNSYLDESTYRAIVKANPAPPHPTGIRTPYVTMGVRFTPEGIRK